MSERNLYDDLIQNDIAQRQSKVLGIASSAVATNPDQFATQRRVASYLGYPTASVEVDPKSAMLEAQVRRIAADAASRPALQRRLGDDEFAKLAHDDTSVLGQVSDGIAATARYVMGATPTGGLPGAVRAIPYDLGKGAAGVSRAIYDFLGWNYGAESAAGFGRRMEAGADAVSKPGDSIIERGVTSGVRSIGNTAVALPLALIPGGQPAAASVIGLSAGGTAYQGAREQGVAPLPAAVYAASQGAIEVATEAPGLGRLVTDTVMRLPAAAAIRRQLAPDIVGEQVATVLQDLNDWAVLPSNSGKTIGDYLGERPQAAAETLIATLVGVGGNVAISKTIQATAGEFLTQQQSAQFAEQDATQLEQLLTAAAASKLRQRAPETFAQLVQDTADVTDGAPSKLYFDAATLIGEQGRGGILTQQQIEELLPTVAPQIAEALETGGTVEVPLGELAANLTGTGLEKALIDNARTAPDALSRVEAQQVAEQQMQFMQSAAQQAVEKSSDALGMQRSADHVRDIVQQQLEAVKRFTPEVNEVYSAVVRDFYTATAGRLGTTPEALYARYPLRIGGVNPATNELLQPAYHGTHARGIERFSTDKIGTGEEAQAFGWGLYFAGNAEVAEFYRRTVSQQRGTDGQLYMVDVPGDDVMLDYSSKQKDQPEAVKVALESLGFPNEVFRVVEGGRAAGLYDTLEEARTALSAADKPGSIKREPASITGKAAYEVLSLRLGSDQAASEALAAAGVPGLRYPDAMSRDQKSTSKTYNYVVFRDDMVDITGTFYQSGREAGDTRFQARAAELAAQEKAPQRSAVGYFSGERTVPTLRTNEEIAAYFTKHNARGMEDWPARPAVKRMVAALRAETLHALQDAGSAVGWYDRKVKAALELIGELHPEILTDEQARFGFITMLAITSNSTKVNENFDKAEALYSQWKKSSQWPTDVPDAKAADQMRVALALMNRLVQERGWEAVRDFMTRDQTIQDIEAFSGVKIAGELRDERVYGAVFLGSKIGAFFNNLYGNFNPVTMDRWFMRTINRVRGNMLVLPASFESQLDDLLETIGDAHEYGGDASVIADEVAAFKTLSAEDRADVVKARATLPETRTYVHERFKVFSKGYKNRTRANMLAKNVYESLTLDQQAPTSGTERRLLRQVMRELQAGLRRDGLPIEMADLQAVLWYSEKDLFAMLKKGRADEEQTDLFGATNEAEDYETAARRVIAQRTGRGIPVRGARPVGAGRARPAQRLDGEQGSRTGDLFQGSEQPLIGLPATVKVAGKNVTFSPFPPAREAARAYTKQAGIDYAPSATYVKVDPERARLIATAFEAMPHNPTDPEVKAAYDALTRETLAQWEAVKATGLQVEFITGDDPYGNPRNAILDVVENNHLWVFPTDSGFGGTESVDVDITGNPLLAVVPGETISGRPVRVNDIFRIVHDYFGHIAEGVGFRADGEENAWRAHWAMFSPEARRALTTETRGQNSWVNFGPFAEQNKTAGPADTQYAPQKIGLLPEWVVNEGATDREAALLNIGLKIDAENVLLTREDVVAALRAVGAATIDMQELVSDTEPTLVVRLGAALTEEQADVVSSALKQDAIAQLTPAGGEIYGPKAKGWRPFNPDFFLMPDGSRASSQQTLAQEPSAPRGTFNPSSLSITLLENADLSTFLHETGHFMLEVMADIASQPAPPAGIADDMAVLLRWFGVKAGDNKTALQTWRGMTLDEKRPYHERFAEAFEQYLFEGKAPTQELQPMFARMRAWMTSVYRSLQAFLQRHKTDLTPTVRSVFDRLIASQEAIEDAERVRAYEPLFKDAANAGMTPEQFEQYLAVGQQATDNAVSALSSRSLRDMRWVANARARALRAAQADVEGKRKETEAEVRAELAATPTEQARLEVRAEQKAVIKASKEAKAARNEWTAEYRLAEHKAREAQADKPEGDRKLEVQRVMLQWEMDNPAPVPQIDDGRMQLIAERNGFDSADALVRALTETPTIEQQVEGLVDRRLLERYGDTVTTAGMERAADEAVHNEARTRFIATGLSALAGGMSQTEKVPGRRRGVNVIVRAAKQYAQELIARRAIRSLRIGEFKAAEARAGKAALEATAAGDTQRAITATRNQLLNNQLVRRATAAQEEVEKGVTFLRRAADNDKLPVEYRDQIEALLERFDLRDVSAVAAQRRQSLSAWLASQRELGVEPELPPGIENEALRKPYQDMTVEEFQGLVASVKQIEHLGRLKTKLLTAKDQREFEAAKEELVESINTNAKGRRATTRTPTTALGRVASSLRMFGANHIKAATWARILDGFKDGGPVWEYIIRPANERADFEATRRAKATKELTAILKPWLKAGSTSKQTYFASIDRSLTRESVLAIALNTGNAGNLQRLLGGESWTEEQIAPVLAALTRADWQVVQNVWDYFESFRGEIAAKQRRVYGTEPDWINPAPRTVTFGDGTVFELKGGYYPIKYDPAASIRAEEFADAEGARRVLQGAHNAATTRRSFTKSRAEEVVGRPLIYTLAGLYSGVGDVIHDLAWHEWLIDANRLMRASDIDRAIRQHYGPEAVRQFKTWRETIATGDVGYDGAIDAALGYLRQSVSVAGLGFNFMSAAMQPLGLTNTITRIGPRWAAIGLRHYLSNPVKATRTARTMSEFMRNRSITRNRELNELRNRVQSSTKTLDAVRSSAYSVMMAVQGTVDVASWLGAYEKAVSAGNDDRRAVALADQAVRDAQSSGQLSDLSAIERGPQAGKLFTVFYSFFNTVFNLIEASRRKNGVVSVKFTADMLLLAVAPSLLGTLLKEALTPGGGDDEEELAKKLAADQISFLMGLMVVVREFGEAAKMMAGAPNYGYQGPAGLRMVGETGKAITQVAQGEADEGLRKALVNMAGLLAGLPAAQINRTVTGVEAITEGKTKNPAALLFGYDDK